MPKPLSPPITYSTTFIAESPREFGDMASKPMHDGFYTRYGNPLHSEVAKAVATLEGAESGLVTSSGMGAISSALIGLLKAGDVVVAQKNHYMGTSKLLGELLARFGVVTRWVDQTEISEWKVAIQSEPTPRLVMLESPTNPNCELTDIKQVCELARKVGAVSIVDNTFATPYNQQPLSLGADLVVHSATKYLGGHHDITAGVVVGTQAMIEEIWKTQIVLGATLSPMDAWLLLRGMQTLEVRVAKINASAMQVAKQLAEHPRVARVSHPGLTSHPQYRLAKKQMRGFGGTFALYLAPVGPRPAQNLKAAAAFVSKLQRFVSAVSLGGTESLAVHAASMWSGTLNPQQMAAAGIEPGLIRLSIGLEDPQHLIDDLFAALG